MTAPIYHSDDDYEASEFHDVQIDDMEYRIGLQRMGYHDALAGDPPKFHLLPVDVRAKPAYMTGYDEGTREATPPFNEDAYHAAWMAQGGHNMVTETGKAIVRGEMEMVYINGMKMNLQDAAEYVNERLRIESRERRRKFGPCECAQHENHEGKCYGLHCHCH
jgi:hypothetical protein